MTKKSVYLWSFGGCKLNPMDLGLFHHYFRLNGWDVVTHQGQADLILLFTCACAGAVEEHVLDTLSRLQQGLRPDQRLVVAGCLPDINPAALDRIFQGPRFGPRDLERIDAFTAPTIPLAEVMRLERDRWAALDPTDREYPIKVGDGCLGACTYCAIRRARGGLTSRSPEQVLESLRVGLDRGFTDFLLVANDLGCYGQDIGSTFAELLSRLLHIAPASCRFSLNYLEPQWYLAQEEALLTCLATERIPKVNIPLQSGNDRVLSRMGRGYSIGPVLGALDRLKRRVPGLRIDTDFIVAFPGETEADFRDTLEAALHFDTAGFFGYSPRPGTPAAQFPDQISTAERLWRFNLLSARLIHPYLDGNRFRIVQI